jgi:hypothetical protein
MRQNRIDNGFVALHHIQDAFGCPRLKHQLSQTHWHRRVFF